ncbi:MAG: sigma-70 family RNA polymerase sigma factor [Myxococcaceae bacterium]|nr:sigma-70 family RNA polymerase sigma factor [Myxococcaceae bacterium]
MFFVFATLLGGEAGPVDEAEVQQLLVAARVGNPRAARRLYALHVTRLYRALRPLCGSDADAEDAVQAAFVDALSHLSRYHPREGRRFLSWLVTLGLNRARKQHGASSRSPATEAAALTALRDRDAAHPEDVLVRRRALLDALAKLPSREREVVSLFYGAELTADEVATLTGLSPSNVRKVCERQRAVLLGLLGEEEPHE